MMRTLITSLLMLLAPLSGQAGDYQNSAKRLVTLGAPIMGNHMALWCDIIHKEEPSLTFVHDGLPTEPECYALRHDHADAIYLTRELREDEKKLLAERSERLVHLTIARWIKKDADVHLYFWEKEGRIDPLLERFLRAAVSPKGLEVSEGQKKYVTVHTDVLRTYLNERNR